MNSPEWEWIEDGLNKIIIFDDPRGQNVKCEIVNQHGNFVNDDDRDIARLICKAVNAYLRK